MKRNQTLLGCVHALLWIGTVVGTQLIFSGSPSRSAYGVLCAWWMTLYIALLIGTTVRALPALFVLMIVALVLDAMKGTGFLYQDAAPVTSGSFWLVTLALLVLWASPVVVNQLAMRVRQLLMQPRGAN